ncbi:MAG: pyridoxamine 5'-phosphate oxidase family protein [Oscillospiraceae bacterium]|jgi:nitroimidazol reductase NimA-like FMN-containing flavoprotein (pyridoxamine 5'-phosphate oxidase superfamily)|nr:pyridoxamine 5'-phosphate oxidase family protein [Oscillospiraceae bacterium]
MPENTSTSAARPMRRADRAVTDSAGLFDILVSGKVLRLGLVDKGRAYIVPMNYGYNAAPDTPPETWRLYVHSAAQGRKLELMRKNPIVTFELDTDHALKEGDEACQYGFGYASIMGEAVVRFLTAYEDKRDALSLLMDHQAHPGNWSFNEDMLKKTTVLTLRITGITGKRCG